MACHTQQKQNEIPRVFIVELVLRFESCFLPLPLHNILETTLRKVLKQQRSKPI